MAELTADSTESERVFRPIEPSRNEADAASSHFRIFRTSANYKNVAFSLLVLSSALWAITAFGLSSLVLPAKQAAVFIFMSLIWAWPIARSIRRVLKAYRGRLRIEPTCIVQRGAVFTKAIDVTHTTEAMWDRTSEARHVNLCSAKRRLCIDVNDFELEDRLWMIHWLRTTLPLEHQHGWFLFCHRLAVPIWQRLAREGGNSSADIIRAVRRRWDWVFIPAILVLVVLAGAATVVLRTEWPFLIPTVFATNWLLLRLATPRWEELALRRKRQAEDDYLSIYIVCSTLGYLMACAILDMLGFPWYSISLPFIIWAVSLWKLADRSERLRLQREYADACCSFALWERAARRARSEGAGVSSSSAV